MSRAADTLTLNSPNNQHLALLPYTRCRKCYIRADYKEFVLFFRNIASIHQMLSLVMLGCASDMWPQCCQRMLGLPSNSGVNMEVTGKNMVSNWHEQSPKQQCYLPVDRKCKFLQTADNVDKQGMAEWNHFTIGAAAWAKRVANWLWPPRSWYYILRIMLCCDLWIRVAVIFVVPRIPLLMTGLASMFNLSPPVYSGSDTQFTFLSFELFIVFEYSSVLVRCFEYSRHFQLGFDNFAVIVDLCKFFKYL